MHSFSQQLSPICRALLETLRLEANIGATWDIPEFVAEMRVKKVKFSGIFPNVSVVKIKWIVQEHGWSKMAYKRKHRLEGWLERGKKLDIGYEGRERERRV